MSLDSFPTYGALPVGGTNVALQPNATLHTPCGHHFLKEKAIKIFGEMTVDGCKSPGKCPLCQERVSQFKDDLEPYNFSYNKPKNKTQTDDACCSRGPDLDDCCTCTIITCELAECIGSVFECVFGICKAFD